MIVSRHKQFRKNYKKRISPNSVIDIKFEERFALFLEDPTNSELKDHALTGKMAGFRAFWVTGDIRVVYFKEGNNTVLYDIGSHNQVY